MVSFVPSHATWFLFSSTALCISSLSHHYFYWQRDYGFFFFFFNAVSLRSFTYEISFICGLDTTVWTREPSKKKKRRAGRDAFLFVWLRALPYRLLSFGIMPREREREGQVWTNVWSIAVCVWHRTCTHNHRWQSLQSIIDLRTAWRWQRERERDGGCSNELKANVKSSDFFSPVKEKVDN